MADLSEGTLVAYVDGELDPREHARVAALVTASPELQARVAVFASTRMQLAGAFKNVHDDPVPQGLLDTVMSSPRAKTDRPSRVASRGWQLPLGWLFAPSALALASIAVVCGLAGWYVGRAQPRGATTTATVLDGDDLATGVLAEALETVTGSASLSSSSSPSIRLRMTFKSSEGWCRQFVAGRPASAGATGPGATGTGVTGVACRDSKGRWQLRAHASFPRSGRSDGIRTAAPDDAALLGPVVDRMIDGDALDAREEADLIASKWQQR